MTGKQDPRSAGSATTPVALAEAGLLPDWLVRIGIRRMLAERLRQVSPAAQADFVAELRRGPLALVPELANEQHYELPPAFFEVVLGPRLKYSCGLWSDGVRDLATAEKQMLALTCERAGIRDGMRVLDLGCGWGSLSLWIAERHPAARVLAVSNSKPQREEILARCAQRGIRNVEVVTADINDLRIDGSFDRVVSVEMFEHMRNYEALLSRIASWLAPQGKLFVHVFCHRELAYPFDSQGPGDWMAEHFFSGGLMPSADLLHHFQRELVIQRQWRVGGEHYHRTCESWLANLDRHRDEALAILAEACGKGEARRWLQRWRLFFMACSELFAYRRGNEWFVSHYLFERKEAAS
jgi:cyclopropane-fatty-acyl-phospholipid synthase